MEADVSSIEAAWSAEPRDSERAESAIRRDAATTCPAPSVSVASERRSDPVVDRMTTKAKVPATSRAAENTSTAHQRWILAWVDSFAS